MRIILIHLIITCGAEWRRSREIGPCMGCECLGPLKAAGYTDIRFVDAMRTICPKTICRAIIEKEKPDIVGATAITPSIYKAERLLQIAKEAGRRSFSAVSAPCSCISRC